MQKQLGRLLPSRRPQRRRDVPRRDVDCCGCCSTSATARETRAARWTRRVRLRVGADLRRGGAHHNNAVLYRARRSSSLVQLRQKGVSGRAFSRLNAMGSSQRLQSP